MLDWINTFPLDCCLLVSDLSDLHSGSSRSLQGEVLCEIYNFLYNDNARGQFYEIIKRSEKPKDHLSNFQLLLTSFPENDTIMKILGGKRLEEIYRVVTAHLRATSSSWRSSR